MEKATDKLELVNKILKVFEENPNSMADVLDGLAKIYLKREKELLDKIDKLSFENLELFMEKESAELKLEMLGL